MEVKQGTVIVKETPFTNGSPTKNAEQNSEMDNNTTDHWKLINLMKKYKLENIFWSQSGHREKKNTLRPRFTTLSTQSAIVSAQDPILSHVLINLVT